MKGFSIATLTFLAFGLAADAQEIKPLGFDTPAAATATPAPAAPTAAPAPAATATPAPAAPTAAPAPAATVQAPAPAAPASARGASTKKVEDHLYEAELAVLRAETANSNTRMWGGILTSVIFLTLLILFILFKKERKERMRLVSRILDLERAQDEFEKGVSKVAKKAAEEEGSDSFPGVPPGAAGVLLIGLLLSGFSAQGATNCSIRGISIPGGVLVKSQDPIQIEIFTSGECPAVAEVISAGGGTSFTEVSTKGKTVMAKAVAGQSAPDRSVNIRLVFTNGTHVDGGSLLIVPPGLAQVRRDLMADNAATKAAASQASKAADKALALAKEAGAGLSTKADKAEVAEAIAPLKARLAELSKESESLRERAERAEKQISALAGAAETLAQGQVALGKRKVRSGFLGLTKSEFEPQVAVAAKQIADAFCPAPPAKSPAVAR